jgi:hypothetical protein
MQRPDLVKRKDRFEKPLEDIMQSAEQHADREECHGRPKEEMLWPDFTSVQ